MSFCGNVLVIRAVMNTQNGIWSIQIKMRNKIAVHQKQCKASRASIRKVNFSYFIFMFIVFSHKLVSYKFSNVYFRQYIPVAAAEMIPLPWNFHSMYIPFLAESKCNSILFIHYYLKAFIFFCIKKLSILLCILQLQHIKIMLQL